MTVCVSSSLLSTYCQYYKCDDEDERFPTLATRTPHRNAQMTSPKSSSTMFLKSRAGRANFDTKFPKPLAWLSVMMSALCTEKQRQQHVQVNWDKTNTCTCSDSPACDVATQDDTKALKESWEQFVNGHVGPSSRAHNSIMGYVLPMDQHIVVGGLHGDNRPGNVSSLKGK